MGSSNYMGRILGNIFCTNRVSLPQDLYTMTVKRKFKYVFMPFIYYVLFNKKINDSNRLESRQCFYSLSDTYWTTNGPPIIFHHEVSPTLRHFLNTDIFGRKEFSTQRHSWLHLFGPSDICHHEEFSIQLQLPAEKVEKKEYHIIALILD